jgi:hypothetical protein
VGAHPTLDADSRVDRRGRPLEGGEQLVTARVDLAPARLLQAARRRRRSWFSVAPY